jgi:outer membrane biosynthesis protein TonB
MSRRPLLVLCTVPAIVLSAAPAALAGEDTPTPTVTEPAPVTVTVPSPPPPAPPPVTVTVPSPPPPPVTVTVPAPAPKPRPTVPEAPKSAPKAEHAPKSSGRPHVKAVQLHSAPAPVPARPVVKPVLFTAAAAPAGGVQAGGGGMASAGQASDWPAFALGGTSLLLLALGGRLVRAPRRQRP